MFLATSWFRSRLLKYSVLFTGFALCSVFLAGCGSGAGKTDATSTVETTSATPEKKGKLHVAESNFNFGTMEVGEQFEHIFELKNIGEGPLKLSKGPPSCVTCTSFEIDKLELAPGETAKATVKWQVKNSNPEFRQYAPIMVDNQPDAQVKLYVIGKISNRIILNPADKWSLGDVPEGSPVVFPATVTSTFADAFEIAEIISSSKFLTVTPTPMSAVDLETKKVKSGYHLKAVLSADVPVGDFREKVLIKLKTPKEIELKVDVTARRSGPMDIFGPGWNQETMTLDVRSFDAKKGLKTRLNLFTKNVEGELKFTKITLTPASSNLQVNLTPDANFKGAGRNRKYSLEFEFPAGSKQAVYPLQTPLVVEAETNQPKIGTIRFKIVGQGL